MTTGSAVARSPGTRRPALGMSVKAQHVLLLGSVLILALTGLPQRFDSFGPSEWLMDAVGGIETLRAVHHAAGAVLVVTALYHVSLVLIAVLAGRNLAPLAKVPDSRDYRDAVQMALYFTGLRRERPALGQPTYLKKFDYWVLAWAIATMTVTGIVRLFPTRATDLLSGDVAAAALETHSDLAPLAVVWVAAFHVAYLMLSPHPEPPRPDAGTNAAGTTSTSEGRR